MEEIALRKPAKTGDWLRLYRLYRMAFPASERKPLGMILKMYRRGKTDVWCICQNDRFRGLAITINSPELILLDYFAVEASCRGMGIGSQTLRKLQQLYGDKGLFMEIESTLEASPNRQQRQKRKRFYLAAGMEELGVLVKLFGVNMELLGIRCQLDFGKYKAFYRDNYNQWAADHITEV